MLKIIKRLFPLEDEGKLNRLTAENEQLKAANADMEAALVELAEMAAAQDDALVELAEMVTEE